MAGRLLHDPEADGWERSDMPIVCETCLGPNPFVRMQKIEFGGQCHISGRPYTVFRWRPGSDARYKKTIICREVAKAKNVCQVCLFDLEYGLPVEVRDKALGMNNDEEAQSAVTIEYQLSERVKNGENDSSFSQSRPNDLLLKLQRTTPYYKRNQAKICSFFVRGECTRGAECPFRHEMPTTGPLSEQNIKDRYYGINDPVAAKMMNRVGDMPKLQPPEDTSITTLYIGGVAANITESDLKDALYSYGELTSVKVVSAKLCAFVTFATRAAAEAAAEATHNKLIVKGLRLRVMWGRPQQPRGEYGSYGAGADAAMMPPPGFNGRGPPQQQQQQHQASGPASSNAPTIPATAQYFGAAPPTVAAKLYPSMDPQQQGTRMPAPGDPTASHKRAAATAPGAATPAAAAAADDASKRQRGADKSPAAAAAAAAAAAPTTAAGQPAQQQPQQQLLQPPQLQPRPQQQHHMQPPPHLGHPAYPHQPPPVYGQLPPGAFGSGAAIPVAAPYGSAPPRPMPMYAPPHPHQPPPGMYRPPAYFPPPAGYAPPPHPTGGYGAPPMQGYGGAPPPTGYAQRPPFQPPPQQQPGAGTARPLPATAGAAAAQVPVRPAAPVFVPASTPAA